MKITSNELDMMCKFEYNVDGHTFKKLALESGMTERLANHIWVLFRVKYNSSFLKLVAHADKKVLTQLPYIINNGVKKYE